jgi:hypothetical protein
MSKGQCNVRHAGHGARLEGKWIDDKDRAGRGKVSAGHRAPCLLFSEYCVNYPAVFWPPLLLGSGRRWPLFNLLQCSRGRLPHTGISVI